MVIKQIWTQLKYEQDLFTAPGKTCSVVDSESMAENVTFSFS